MGRGGLRERKRLETLRRIAEKAQAMFISNGYEATTLNAIAEAAGISRRTFFYYFKSKEEILLAWQHSFADAMRAALIAEPTKQKPLNAARNALMKLASRYQTDEALAIDRLLRSTESLRASKQAQYVQQEQAMFEALCELWPAPKRRKELRVVAMVSIGALRLAVEAWSQSGGRHSLAKYVEEAFEHLRTLPR